SDPKDPQKLALDQNGYPMYGQYSVISVSNKAGGLCIAGPNQDSCDAFRETQDLAIFGNDSVGSSPGDVALEQYGVSFDNGGEGSRNLSFYSPAGLNGGCAQPCSGGLPVNTNHLAFYTDPQATGQVNGD